MRATANLSNLFRFKMFAGGDVPVPGLQSRVGMHADPALVVASRAMTDLRYRWPGNVRELLNVLAAHECGVEVREFREAASSPKPRPETPPVYAVPADAPVDLAS